MRRSAQYIFLYALIGVIAVAAIPAVTHAQKMTDADLAALAGPWRGNWSGGGFEYEANMKLTALPNGDIEGSITWTLRAAPRDRREANQVGATGVEYVRGSFRPDGFLSLDGYRKDDPHNLIGLDKYRLVVSETRMIMGGITWHHGPWNGRFYLSR